MICRMNLIHCEFANSDGYCERTACCNPNIVGNTIKYEEQKAYSQQYVDKLKAKYSWHTEPPTEGGLYFVYEKYVGYAKRDLPTNISKKDLEDSFYNVIAWQKIEPYEATKGRKK